MRGLLDFLPLASIYSRFKLTTAAVLQAAYAHTCALKFRARGLRVACLCVWS